MPSTQTSLVVTRGCYANERPQTACGEPCRCARGEHASLPRCGVRLSTFPALKTERRLIHLDDPRPFHLSTLHLPKMASESPHFPSAPLRGVPPLPHGTRCRSRAAAPPTLVPRLGCSWRAPAVADVRARLPPAQPPLAFVGHGVPGVCLFGRAGLHPQDPRPALWADAAARQGGAERRADVHGRLRFSQGRRARPQARLLLPDA